MIFVFKTKKKKYVFEELSISQNMELRLADIQPLTWRVYRATRYEILCCNKQAGVSCARNLIGTSERDVTSLSGNGTNFPPEEARIQDFTPPLLILVEWKDIRVCPIPMRLANPLGKLIQC